MEMETSYQNEDEVVFTLNMDGNEILDLKQTFPYKQEVKVNVVEDLWDTDSVEFLLLSYYQYIHSFRASEDETEKQWINISARLSKTPESCQRQFELLQNKYFELARSQLQEDSNVLNAVDIDWPYFDLFFKMCQYTESVKRKPIHDVDKLNIELLQYYIKHKRLFMAAEFGGEMRLWSMFAKSALEPEECAYKIRFLRWNYLTLKAKLKEINSPNIEKMYSRRQEYRMWSAAFDPPASMEPVSRKLSQTQMRINEQSRPPRKTKWRNDDIMSLIVFYSQNRNLFKDTINTRNLWKPFADRVNRTTSECQRKFSELTKKYEHFNDKLLQKPNAIVPWRYYTILDNLFTESKVSENTTLLDVKSEMDVSENDCSTENVAMLEENVPDDDTVCIIVASEEDNEQLHTIVSTAHSTNEDNIPHSLVLERRSFRWAKKAQAKLLNLYKKYIEQHRNQEIYEVEMWKSIGAQMQRSPVQCRKRFNMLKVKYLKMLKVHNRCEEVNWPYFSTFGSVLRLKPVIRKDPTGMLELERMLALSKPIKTEPMNDEVPKMLTYYLANVEEFVSPKYNKNKVWAGMGKVVGMGWLECRRMFTELQENYRSLVRSGEAHSFAHSEMFEQIWEKEREILAQMENDPTITYFEEEVETVGFDVWDDSETLKLLEWYYCNLHRFKNRKYVHKYIWRETETALGLNPGRCSKKMRDIRSAYRVKLLEMEKQRTTECQWEYFDICKRIYGTDLEDPFLSKTKIPKQYKEVKTARLIKKCRHNKKVMSKETVEKLLNYYLEKYDLFQRSPTGVARQVWQELASEIGFSNLACQKKMELLKRQYKVLLSQDDKEALDKWPYTGLMRKVNQYIDYKELLLTQRGMIMP